MKKLISVLFLFLTLLSVTSSSYACEATDSIDNTDRNSVIETGDDSGVQETVDPGATAQ